MFCVTCGACMGTPLSSSPVAFSAALSASRALLGLDGSGDASCRGTVAVAWAGGGRALFVCQARVWERRCRALSTRDWQWLFGQENALWSCQGYAMQRDVDDFLWNKMKIKKFFFFFWCNNICVEAKNPKTIVLMINFEYWTTFIQIIPKRCFKVILVYNCEDIWYKQLSVSSKWYQYL